MKVKRLLILFSTGVILLALSCKVSMITHEDITDNNFEVAVIDSESNVMASDLYMRLAKSDLVMDGGILDSTTYFDTLQSILLDSLISLEAKEINLRIDPPLYRTYKFRFNEFYVKFIYDNFIRDSIQIDSAAVDSFIKVHPEAYSYEEQVRARHIVISPIGLGKGEDSLIYKDFSEDQLDSVARVKIYDIKKQIDSGVDFGLLAFEHSMHRESGKQDGELGYFTKNHYRKEFEDVAFSTPIGTISQPFKTADGWHVVEVIDHVDSGLAPMTPEIFDDARTQCHNHLSGRRGAQFVDSIVSLAVLRFNDSALSKDVVEVPDTTWAMIINDIDTLTFLKMNDYLHQFKINAGLNELTLEDKKRSLMSRSVKYIIMKAGDDLGFNQKPEVIKYRENLYHKYAIIHVKKGREVRDYEPLDSLVEDYYRKNINDYIFEKPVYIQHIISEDSLFAEFLRDQALSGIDFLQLAKEHYPGAEEIRVAAADLGYIGPGEMPDEFYKTAMITSIGKISHPIKTEWGYHIIKVVDKRYNRSLDDVRASIVSILTKKYEKEFARDWELNLFEMHDIEYNLEPIKRIKLASKERR